MLGGTVMTHRADVQGLRGVAVLLVVAFHAGLPLTGGFVGVDVFFVISGYVIAAMLARQLEADEFTFRQFYVRRARRLLPALGVLLAFVAVAGMLLLSPYGPQQATADTGVAAALFHANLQLNGVPGGYFDLAAEANALLHTWSLSVEEQFYFVFPAVVVGVWRLSRRVDGPGKERRSAAAVIALVSVASFVLAWWAVENPSKARGVDFAFYSPFTRAWEFGVGALLALWAPKLPAGLAWVGALGVLAAAVQFDGATAFPGPSALLPVLGTALILAAGLRALEARAFVWLGDLSYGWYLWHWPFIVFAAAMWPRSEVALVAAAVGSLAPAVLSYRLVEQPIRFTERVRGVRAVAMAGVCSLVPIVAFVAAPTIGGEVDVPLHERQDTATLPNSGGAVVLVGDSNAGHFMEPVQTAPADLGYPVLTRSRGGCPFADVLRESDPGVFDGPACRRHVMDETLPHFEASPPALVVVAMAGPLYLTEASLTLEDPVTGEVATSVDRKAALWHAGLERMLRRLTDADVPVLFVHSVPHFGEDADAWELRRCPTVRLLTGKCGVTVPRAEAERRRAAAHSAERRAIDAVPGVASTDFFDHLCTDEVCSTHRGEAAIYRDATHLSVEGALRLTDRFTDLIDTHASVN